MMQLVCPIDVERQKREDPVASSRTGSPRVQKGGAEEEVCKRGATARGGGRTGLSTAQVFDAVTSGVHFLPQADESVTRVGKLTGVTACL